MQVVIQAKSLSLSVHSNHAESGVKHAIFQSSLHAWIACAQVARAASLTASEKVGWPWQVLAMSSEEAPYSIPITHSWINSPALGPMMWAPRILSVSASATNLTKPSASSTVLALLLAANGNLPVCRANSFCQTLVKRWLLGLQMRLPKESMSMSSSL